MNKILLETHFNYADEFDVKGLIILDDIGIYDRSVNDVKNALASSEEPLEIYFGTNECIKILSIDDYTNGITLREISNDLSTTLEGIFGGTDYGLPIFYEE